MMGRLMDRLKVQCRRCNHWHIPHRLTAKYLDGSKKHINMLQCVECGHFWIDSAMNKGDK